MNIKSIIDEFMAADFSTYETVRNRDTNALWLRRDDSKLMVSVRRDSDDSIIVRLFKLLALGTFSGINYRITISTDHIELSTIEMATDSLCEEIKINNYHTLVDESEFFQQSLVRDFADLESTSIEDLRYMYNFIVNLVTGVL